MKKKQNRKDDGVKVYKTEAERTRAAETGAKIAAYQKKKLRKRVIILGSVVVVLVLGIVLVGQVFGKLGEPVTVTFSPAGPANPAATFNPSATADPNNPEGPLPTDDPGAPETIPGRKPGIYTFVIVGEDQGNGNTDTIIIGAYNDVDKKLTLVNLPRDTMVNVSWAAKKACTIYYLPTGHERSENLKTQISNLTGFTPDAYIAVSLDAFERIVDTIGGVDFQIPVNMNYDDPTQNLHIHFNAGMTHLSGSQAKLVARFRQNNDKKGGFPDGDIGRINNQQNLLKAIAKKTLTPANLLKYNDFAKIFDECVETDLSLLNIAWYAQKILALNPETDIEFTKVPANYNDSVNKVSYCTIKVDEWLTMVNEKLNPFEYEMTDKDVNILTKNSKGVVYATSGKIEGNNNWLKLGGSDSAKDNATEPSATTAPSSGGSTTPSSTAAPSATAAPPADDGGLFYVPPTDNGGSSGGEEGEPLF